MTIERKREIIDEIIPQGERLTGREFVERLIDKAAETYEQDETHAREYIEVASCFLDKYPDAMKKWHEALPTSEEFGRRLDEKCMACEVGEYAEKGDDAALAVCERCKELREKLKADYARTHCEA